MPSNYFSKELIMLKVVGINIMDNQSIVYNIYAFIYLSMYLTYPIVAFSDLFKYDFDVVSNLLIYELSTTMINIELVVTMINRTKLQKLLQKLQEPPFAANPERGGDLEEKLIKSCVRFTKLQSVICWVSVLVTVGLATVITLMKRIRSSDYHDWEFAYGPITVLNVTYSPNYEITWLYQILCTSTIGLNHCTTILIMAGILTHVSVQFKILQNNIKRLVQNAHNLMMKDCPNQGSSRTQDTEEIDASKIPWKYLKQSCDSTILYHSKILHIASEMGDIFSMLTLTIFLFTLGVLCFLVYHASLLELTDIRLLKAFTDAITGVLPILLLCYWSQEVVYESEQVATAVFDTSIIGGDLKFQKSLNMIIRRSQRPLQLKAGKLIYINLDTFVWIVRTSYSVFMVLRTINSK